MQKKVVFIVGPTAVGKTEIAFEIGNFSNGELVSADSVQIYKECNIISGKDIPKGYKFFPLSQFSTSKIHAGYYTDSHNSPIHLLDVVDPTTSFNVSHFFNIAQKTINFIHKKNKLPVVVGGTGLYVKSLTDGFDVKARPDEKLRKELESLTVSELQERLTKNSPQEFENMNESDRKNPRRLIRKIEIHSGDFQTPNSNRQTDYEQSVIGLRCDRQVLNQRIDVRVDARLKNGALEEAQKLFENYENLAQQIKDANGFKQLFQFLKKEIEYDEAIYRWKVSEYRHAKNQMTWFEKYGNVKWFDISDKNYKDSIKNNLKAFLN